MKTGKYAKAGREMQVGDIVHFKCKDHPLSGKGVVFMGKEVDGLGEDPFSIRDTRTGRNNGRIYPYYLSRCYMNAYDQGKEDAEGLKTDELREVLLTVKGIGPAKTENIMEVVEKALSEKGKH